MVKLIQLLITAYQYLLSPWFGNCCRFSPSCSEYMRQALAEHGFWCGGFLGVKRLLRCQPWGGAGFDPVPTNSKPKVLADDKVMAK